LPDKSIGLPRLASNTNGHVLEPAVHAPLFSSVHLVVASDFLVEFPLLGFKVLRGALNAEATDDHFAHRPQLLDNNGMHACCGRSGNKFARR